MSRQGYVAVDGWAGRHDYAVIVVGETPKRYRIQAVMEMRLPNKRLLKIGDEALVPKRAVRFATNCFEGRKE